jgi:sigma-B regulation protein RsbU (phosphoserine phosphatase)
VLNDISRELTSILNLDQLFKRIGDLLLRLIDYQMFSILLLNDRRTKLQHRFSLRFNENVQLKHDVPRGGGLVGYAVEHNEVVVVQDVTRDERYIPLNPETMSELCVPLVYKGTVIGVLDLEHTRRSYFTGEHARVVKTLAAQIAISIENARLYEEIERQEIRLEKDLLLARELQYRLLPQNIPVLEKAEVAARSVPARTIGGDLYDYVRYGGTELTALAIGDVSGKGAPASIYEALVSGILRSHAAERPGAAEMLTAINRSLAERPIAAQFVSIIYALLDESDMSLRIANSGLPYPYRCGKNGKAELVEISGLPLGLFGSVEYDEVKFETQAGDVFLFFSDGISDAQNETGVVFGMNRLARVLERHRKAAASEIMNAVFAAVNAFVGSVEAFDDQTVAVLKIKEKKKKK